MWLFCEEIAKNPFKVSVDIVAAGVAENNFVAQESGYSNAIKNDAIIGISPEFTYTDGLKVEDVIINFDLDSSVVNNTNGKYTSLSDEFVGIKRLNVFKFFEDVNMLLPIETFHDVENNRVYTHVDELGTYCLMDMEIWLDNLGIKADGYSTANVRASIASSNDSEPNDNKNQLEKVDVFIVPYAKNVADIVRGEYKVTVKTLFESAKRKNKNLHIYLVSPTGGLIDELTFYNEAVADATANRIPDLALTSTDSYMLNKAAVTIKKYSKELDSKSEKYCFVIDAFANPKCSSTNINISEAQSNGVDFYFERSTVNDNELYYKALSGNDVHIIKASNGRYNFGDYIDQTVFGDSEESYKILSAAGWKEVTLDKPITQDYRGRAAMLEQAESENTASTLRGQFKEKYGYVDSDGDTLLDLEEITSFKTIGNLKNCILKRVKEDRFWKGDTK